jgi:hypothetical protein
MTPIRNINKFRHTLLTLISGYRRTDGWTRCSQLEYKQPYFFLCCYTNILYTFINSPMHVAVTIYDATGVLLYLHWEKTGSPETKNFVILCILVLIHLSLVGTFSQICSPLPQNLSAHDMITSMSRTHFYTFRTQIVAVTHIAH